MIDEFPARPQRRRHGPVGYKGHRAFKPWLRDEFHYRCVYCLFREQYDTNGPRAFGVDHFRPKSRGEFAGVSLDYDNLHYSCNLCNQAKGYGWPELAQQRQGDCFLDPCQDAIGKHLRWDGTAVVALTRTGQWHRDVLQLNESEQQDRRREVMEYLVVARDYVRDSDARLDGEEDARRREKLLQTRDRAVNVLRRLLGPPRNPDDLSLLRPPRNRRPEGIPTSYCATREWPPEGMVGPEEFLRGEQP